jgi:DNA-binding SARP family transcriptional activator
MDFRILGPLEVCDNGRVLPLGGAKQRTLLAILILHANEVVSAERLLDDLWGERQPTSGAKALHVYISQLRKVIGDDRVLTRAPGYMLRLDPDELDAARFQRLREQAETAEPQEAGAILREAISLWRGAPLADVAYESFAQSEIARLEELRTSAIEQRIEADLALGGHAELVGEVEALVREHPLRERLREQLMLALYRSGRQAEALTVYQDARRALVEELGIEPGRSLRELHQTILRQDPALEISAAAEPPRSVFVGREAELDELLAGVEEAFAGHGRLFLLVGEPGIGKSRLADEVIALARVRGARILVGRCWEAGGAPAYWPWVESLRAYVRESDAVALGTQLGADAANIAQIVPELRQHFPDLPKPPSLESEGARFRLFDAVAEFLRNASERRPIVLFLDDLHAADTASLLLLQFVARQLAKSRLLVLGAYRDVDPTPGEPLAAMLADVAREPATRRVSLGGFSRDEVTAYVELVAANIASPELAAALYEQTEGNPLFVGETVRLLARDESTARQAAIPQTVRDVIARRLGRLSPECNHVLTLASVLGREFSLGALELVSERSRETLLEVLDEAAAERVVGEVPGAVGRLRFAHALIRDTLYDELPATRRVRLHARAGTALEAIYRENAEPHLAELAHHFSEAAWAGNVGKAIDYAQRAGDRAVSLLAFEEAVTLYRLALQLAEDAGATRCELLLALGEAQARAGDTPAANATFREAADLAASQRLPEQLARAALGYGGRLIWDVSRDDAQLVSLLERALNGLGHEDSILRVRLLARLAGGPLRASTADADRRRSLGAEALDMARRIGEPSPLAYALHGHIASHHAPDFTLEQADKAKELVQVALQAGDLERAVEGYEIHLLSSIELADLSSAYADLDAMATLAEELRQPAQQWVVGVYRAMLALLEGRLEEAEQLVIDTRPIGERAMSWNAAVTYGLQLYVLRREQGRVHEVEKLVRRAAADNPAYPIWRCVLTDMLTELRRPDEARTGLESLGADDFSRLPFDEEWEVSMCFLGETAARLGDSTRAATIYELLLPYADRVAVSYPEISLGPVSRFLGMLATATARWNDAERHFRDALDLSARIGARPSLAHTQTGYARMLLARDEPSGSEQAAGLLDQALATYRDLGMDSHFMSADRLRERATLGSA